MGEVTAKIYLQETNKELGWTYSHWDLDFGKGQGLVREDSLVKCAETSQRYMNQGEALEEAKSRIRLKIKKECGAIPDDNIHWTIQELNDSETQNRGW